MLPALKLKGTIHANIEFGWQTYERSQVRTFLEWLRSQSEGDVARLDLETHLDELERRLHGDLSITDLAARENLDPRYLRVPSKLLQYYRYAVFSVGELSLSVDVLNPAEELGVSLDNSSLILELFATQSRERRRCGSQIAELVQKVATELRPRYIFGGDSSFLGALVNARWTQRGAVTDLNVQNFLWPLTFSSLITTTGDILSTLPVHRAVHLERGVLVQVFADLTNGQADDYERAAHNLGLRSVWELLQP